MVSRTALNPITNCHDN